MKHTDLHSACHVFCSDEDQTTVEDITVGFDSRQNLIILLEYTDYDSPSHNSSIHAKVDADEAAMLAARLEIPLTRLPSFISESMDDYSSIINPTLSQVRDCFKEITECLLDEGCHFSIIRTPSRNGFTPC